MILEASWEVCNKMGGIYTVLSSRADIMSQRHTDHLVFIGPLLAGDADALPLDFVETDEGWLGSWLTDQAPSLGLRVRVGRWAVPGEPPVVLVDFRPLWETKDDLFFEIWRAYGLESDKGYGDYDESCLFALAASRVMQSIVSWRGDETNIALFNEWQTAMGLLYLKLHAPEIRTLFITHATTVGRSIAGNDKELYAWMSHYDGDQMARELGVEAKHSVEKLAAHEATVFATVSKLTAREAEQLLGRRPIVLPNGFHVGYSPLAAPLLAKRRRARRLLAEVARWTLRVSQQGDRPLHRVATCLCSEVPREPSGRRLPTRPRLGGWRTKGPPLPTDSSSRGADAAPTVPVPHPLALQYGA